VRVKPQEGMGVSREHRSDHVMRAPIVTDRVVWSFSLSVGLSPSQSCKNDWTDRDAVCVDDTGGPRESRVANSKI